MTLAPGGSLPAAVQRYDRTGKLSTINGHVLDVPDSLLTALSTNANVTHVHGDRSVHASNFRTSIASGAFFARTDLGYTGAGVEVAVIDSGLAFNHDDLKNVTFFKDFTSVIPRLTRFDDFGHGTHVAGILAGNGKDSSGQNAGIAPGASLAVLKVLDRNGNGTVANVIAALDWVAANYNQNGHNIRVVNLSIGAPVTESYDVDPLTLATKRLVDLGITVVAAAGNGGNDTAGHPVWGAISSPANAPWVLTVGASSTEGTLTRADDKVAKFSSRGPTLIDSRGQARSRRVWRRHGVDDRHRGVALFDQRQLPRGGHGRDPADQAVHGAQRHQHVGAGRQRHRRADAPGESVADAEPDQGDSAVHRRNLSGLQPARRRRGLPQRARRRPPGEVLRVRAQRRRAGADRADLGPADSLGQPPPPQRLHAAERQCLEPQHPLGLGEDAGRHRRQHRLGHGVRRQRLRRQHRVGHGRRRRQHRLGHRWRRRQHRVGHGRRQHRLGHGR